MQTYTNAHTYICIKAHNVRMAFKKGGGGERREK
jgi:hypothetical protein